MGKVEISAKHLRVRGQIRQAILATVSIAGILAVTMIAPNIFQALPRLMGREKFNAKFGYRARTAAGRLAAQGYLKLVQRDGRKYYEMTQKGREALSIEERKMLFRKKQKPRWDRRYRLIIFDISEKRKNIRDRLRLTMRELGFLRLQDSVWVYPYDCEDFIALLKRDLTIGKEVLYAVVEQIENDLPIRQYFGLPHD